jgi:8-oxo-dGTP diphosphatase
MELAHDSDEAAFLASYDASRFPRPSVAVDVALMTVHEGRLWSLLLQRGAAPFRGRHALPGGFVGLAESLDEAVARTLRVKCATEGVFVEQLFTFGAPERDPRLRVVSVAYYALVDHARLARALAARPELALAALDVPWSGVEGGEVRALAADGHELALAFDHARILGLVVQRLRGKLDYAALGFQLLPRTFTLRALQTVHEVVLGHALNKDSFRRRMLATGLIEPTGERERDVLHRPAELYRIRSASAV